MSEYYTIEDIKERTNLNIDFIRRCIRFFKDELSPYITKAEFNSLRFDSNALSIFDKIMQYKSDGLTLPIIKEKIKLPTKHEQTIYNNSIQTLPNINNDSVIQSLLNEVRESRLSLVSTHNQLTKAFETIVEKEKVIENQNYSLKLLTDGRNPEEVRAEIYKKELKIKEQEEKLSLTEASLQDKEIQLQALKSQQAQIELEEQEKITKKNKILNELKSLEGKLFVSKKRKELISSLQEIS